MSLKDDAIAEASKLLKLGKVQEADDILTAAATLPANVAAGAAGSTAPEDPPPPPPPRNPQAIITDLFTHLVSRAGNPPALEALLRELDQAVSPPPAS
jgi:hypothetical protein